MASIAVSGLPGAGSTTLAKALAKLYALYYFSPGLVFKRQSRGSETDAAIATWKGVGSEKSFHEKLDNYQKALAERGCVVLDGKLAIYMTKERADFSVYLDIPREARARRTAERDGLPYEEVLQKMADREQTEEDEWHRMYGFKYRDQRYLADLVISDSELGPQEVLSRVVSALREKGIEPLNPFSKL